MREPTDEFDQANVLAYGPSDETFDDLPVPEDDYDFLLDLIADTDFSNTLEIDMDNLNPDYYID